MHINKIFKKLCVFYGLAIYLKVRIFKLIRQNFVPQNEILNAKHILMITFKFISTIDSFYKPLQCTVRQQQPHIGINKISEI